MALNTRLTQNIDLQADGTALVKALNVIESSLNKIVGTAGSLSKTLEGGANAGTKAWNNQLKQLNILIGQAQNLQKLLDANQSKRAGGLLGMLDEQALGKKGAAASRLAQDLTATSTASQVLEKRLGELQKRFAKLTLEGRTIGQRDLAKQFNTQEAIKDVRALEREFQKLNGQSKGAAGTKSQQETMARLRTEIIATNAELAKMGQNYRRTDFSPQIAQLRTLTDQYRKAVTEARKFELAQPGRAQSAQRTAVSILNQSDSQRLAAIQRSSSSFSFPTGISQTVSQNSAETALAASLQKRYRLLQMIQAAQDRGAPTRSVERLNQAYERLGQRLGEDFRLLQQINKEINNTPQAKAERARQQINETLFGDGGGAFAKRIAGASIITTGVFAAINALKQSIQFVIEYEAALKQLQAISGSTDSQMRVLAEGINTVARSSIFSTLEITKAATVIAQAGFSAQETAQVLRGAITLSTASGSDPSQSVEVLTSALGAFQLQASEADRVVDTLVTGLNKSKLSMEQMGQAIQYAGATAKESGIRFEELTAISASLANAGIRSGSTIGTGLRQLLVDLKTPTEDFKKELKDVGLTVADVDVKSKGFAGVVKTLAEAGFTAEAAYSSFETRAASAFLAFKNQVGVYDELALAIARGGAAQEAQAKSMDSLSAQFNRFKNDLGTVVSALAGPFLSSLKVVTSALAVVLEAFIDAGKVIGGWFSGDLYALGETFKALALTLTGFAVGGPLGAMVGLFISLTSTIGGLNVDLDELRTKTSDAEARFNTQVTTVANLDEAINGLIDRQASLKTNSSALQTETVTLGERFVDLYQYLGKAAGSYDELLNAMLRYRGEALKQQKLEAETLKTNAEIELRASQTKLRGSNGVDGFFVGPQATKAQAQLAGQGPKVNRLVRNALGSEDLATVTTARNFVAKENANSNGDLSAVLAVLDERLILVKQVASLQAQVSQAERSIDVANAASTPEALARNRNVTGFRGQVNGALSRFNAGDATALNATIKAGERGVADLKAQLSKVREGTAEYIVLSSDLSQAEAELSRLIRERRQKAEADAKVRPDRAAKGLNLTGTQVKSEITKAFPGANVYSEKPRSLATQQRLYANYKAGRGPLAAKPGTSNHGTGNAIDMTPLRGVSIDQVAAYLEGLGLEVTERLVEKSPLGGTHWHLAWKAKTSAFQTREDSAIKSLQSAQATNRVGAGSSAIAAIISKGKAGVDTPANLKASLEKALGDYGVASLAKFDSDNPSAGLSGAALELRNSGRAELQNKIKEDMERFRAELYRSIGDVAEKTLDTAFTAIDEQLANDTFNAGAGVRAIDSRIARSSSRLNSANTGAGTSYYLQQRREIEQINNDRLTVAAQDQANARKAIKLDDFKTEIDLLPEGEDKANKLATYTQKLLALNEAMRQTDLLQQSINDRTEVYTNDLSFEDRLKNAAAAWADNSGAMQDWNTTVENSVGPALDLLSGELTNLFQSLMDGTKSLGSSLAGLAKAFGQFVLQIIAKALALQAVKWLLSLVGLQLGTSAGGTTIQRKMTGGYIEPKKMMVGGQTSPGYIGQGVANRDTVPIMGARGEFMLRKAAVDSLGLSNVDALNRQGSAALKKMGGGTTIIPAARQEMNLYVIKPDEKPQLGPKDMVLAITDDMLQGGVTKQLVRKISQGAM